MATTDEAKLDNFTRWLQVSLWHRLFFLQIIYHHHTILITHDDRWTERTSVAVASSIAVPPGDMECIRQKQQPLDPTVN